MSNDVFSYNRDINKNAYLNWRMDNTDDPHNFKVLASGYAEAAKLMTDDVLADNTGKRADVIIFPILLCINTSIELYEKSVLMLLNKIPRVENDIKRTHNIKNLFKQMTDCMKEHKLMSEKEEEALTVIKEYTDNLNEYIADGSKPQYDFVRYPQTSTAQPQFYLKTHDNVTVDLENLKKIIEEITDLLYGVYCKIYDITENIN